MQYRINTNRQKDKEYRKKTRTINIGDKISLMEVVYMDGMPRENIYEVKIKRPMEAYLLQSILTNKRERLDPVH